MTPLLLKSVFFPLYQRIKGTGVLDRLRESRHNQWLPREAVLTLQKEKLVRLLRHAFQNVPFYRASFEAAGIGFSELEEPSVISRIPLLTKTAINANRQNMLAQNKAGGRLIANSTSGSTGEALYFFTDMQSWACRRATVIRNQEWLGIQLGERQASLWGAAMDIRRSETIRNQIHRWFNNYMLLSSYDLSPGSLQEYVDRLNQFQPILLTSYPGPMSELARFMAEKEYKIPTLRAVISSAETLYPWQREISEHAFACSVYNRYGCREFGDIAHECERREGLHINADRVHVEMLDENLSPSETGRTGEVVITDLDNYGMPLIRYRIGDLGALAGKICSCGRGLPMMQTVEGRTLDIIRTPDGKAIGGTFWTILFKSRPGIVSFQLIQDNIDGVTVRYIKDPRSLKPSFDLFIMKIREKCGMNFQVVFDEVEEIPKTKSGKTQIVISNLKSD